MGYVNKNKKNITTTLRTSCCRSMKYIKDFDI